MKYARAKEVKNKETWQNEKKLEFAKEDGKFLKVIKIRELFLCC